MIFVRIQGIQFNCTDSVFKFLSYQFFLYIFRSHHTTHHDHSIDRTNRLKVIVILPV